MCVANLIMYFCHEPSQVSLPGIKKTEQYILHTWVFKSFLPSIDDSGCTLDVDLNYG